MSYLKIRSTVCLFFALFFTTLLPAQRYQWVESLNFNNVYNVSASGITTDLSGNAYMCGTHNDTADFAGIQLFPRQRWEGFLTKLDVNNNLQWVYRTEQMPGPATYPQNPWAGISTIQYLADNTIAGSIGFRDNLLIMGDTLYSDFIYNFAVTRWDTAGNVIDYVHIDASKANASLIATGTNVLRFTPSGSFTLVYRVNGTVHTSKGDSLVSDSLGSIIIAQFTPAGNLEWTYDIPASKYRFTIGDFDVDDEGNVYFTGHNRLDSLPFGNQKIPGDYTTYIFKLNTFGSPEWARPFASGVQSGTLAPGIGTIAIDATSSGEIYAAAGVSFPYKIGNTTVGSGIVPGNNVRYAFLAKLNQLGNPLWVTEIVDTTETRLLGFHWNSTLEKIFITGAFGGGAKLGNFQLKDSSNAQSGLRNHYFAQVDSSGDVDWVLSGVGGPTIRYTILSSDVQGNLHFQGMYQDSSKYGSFTVLPPSPWIDIVYGRIENQGTAIPAGVSQHHTTHANSNMMGGITANEPGIAPELDWLVYPTVSTGTFSLYHQDIGSPEASIRVFNTTGQTVSQATLKRQTVRSGYQLDLSTQKPGIYFLKLETGSKVTMRKIMLIR